MRFPNASPTLNFGEAIERSANNLLNINGRSRRSEFWWTMLVVAISFMIPCISSIVILLTIPLTIRRLHDTGRSGLLLAGDIILSITFTILTFLVEALNSANLFYYIIFVATVIYNIVIFSLCCMDSEPYPNQYGESPKYNNYDNNNNAGHTNNNLKFS